jgi:polyhydroxybutyrate depolymerase
MKKGFPIIIILSLLLSACSAILEFTGADYELYLYRNEIKRRYDVYLPEGYNENKATPLVIYLHGGGGNVEGARNDGWNKAANLNGFILVSPAGSGPDPKRLLTWNAGSWEGGTCCGYAYENNIDDVGFISQLIDTLPTKYNVDTSRIYITGISNGGMMAYRLVCELADKIAAVAVVAPPAIPQGCQPSRPVPIMHIHGTADPCVPYDGGPGGKCIRDTNIFETPGAVAMVDTWREMYACTEDSTQTFARGKASCITYSPCLGKAAVSLCTLQDAGHTWPGGPQYLPKRLIGSTSDDLGNAAIWKFLSQFQIE